MGIDRTPPIGSARVWRSTDQTITTATPTAISYDAESGNHAFDQGGYWAVGSPTRLTAPIDGTYLIQFGHHWDASATPNTYREAFIRLNGTTEVGHDIRSPVASASQGTSNHVSIVLVLAKGDYVEVIVEHDQGADQSVVSDADDSPWFSITYLG